jgi:hypothetical protein
MDDGSVACLAGHEELRQSLAIGDRLRKRNTAGLGLGGEDCWRCKLDGGGGLNSARGCGQRLRPEDDSVGARPGDCLGMMATLVVATELRGPAMVGQQLLG